MSKLIRGSAVRPSDNGVDILFRDRWSPRAFSGAAVDRNDLMKLFEAASWAPSAFNEQPWRFFFGLNGTPAGDMLFSFLVEFNQGWAKNAGALVLIASRKTSSHNGKPFPTHSFDTGAAWENLALQATSMGLIAHGMAGFDYEKAAKVLKLPEYLAVEAMVAIGYPGDPATLPPELAAQEKPSGRKPLSELVFEGAFKE